MWHWKRIIGWVILCAFTVWLLIKSAIMSSYYDYGALLPDDLKYLSAELTRSEAPSHIMHEIRGR